MKPNRIDVRWLLWALVTMLITAMWLSRMTQLNEAKTVHLDSMLREASSLAKLFSVHTLNTIERADQTLIRLRARYNAVGMALDITQETESKTVDLVSRPIFAITNKNDDVILANRAFIPVNLSGREHITIHATTDQADLFIGKPVVGRISQKWAFQMTRRINNPDGTFNGVILASIDPQGFTRLYDEIDVGKKGIVSLIGSDGVIRARRLGDDDTAGQDISASAPFQAMLAGLRSTEIGVSKVDGRQRAYAYVKVRQYPLYVAVGIDVEERLTEYNIVRQQALLSVGIATALILFAALGIHIMMGRLVKSNAQAVMANQAKTRFLSHMSHELRTPLNSVLGYSELLIEELSSVQHVIFARAIHGSGLRLLALIESILELTMLTSNSTKLALSIQDENLHEMMQEAISLRRDDATAKNMAIDCTIDPDVPVILPCDRTKLLRVLDKLLHNALQFTDAGAVRINITLQQKYVLFQVIDTGPGVPLALQQKIFKKFVQGNEATTRSQYGVGLGLTLATRLVELMGGRISLQSLPGEGSTFAFTLPLKTHDVGTR